MIKPMLSELLENSTEWKMLLAKSCYTKNHIKNGTLKLGTLHEYRATEIQQIADTEEGLLTFSLKFDGEVKLKSMWVNTFFGGVMRIGNAPAIRFPGTFKAKIPILHITEQKKESITVANSTVNITRESLNSFIFCMSSIQQKQDCVEMFPMYDDYWYINQNNALKFGINIGNALYEKIKANRKIRQHIIPENISLDRLQVVMRHQHVKYIPREIHITDNNLLLLDDFIEHMKHITFIKPPTPFESEQEYRFEYQIVADGMIIEPLEKFVILDAQNLQHFVL